MDRSATRLFEAAPGRSSMPKKAWRHRPDGANPRPEADGRVSVGDPRRAPPDLHRGSAEDFGRHTWSARNPLASEARSDAFAD